MNLFEKKCAEENETVKMYFDDNDLFGAWIHIIRETNIKDGQALFDELEKVLYRKSSNFTDDEFDSLDCEFCACRRC